MRSVVQKTTNFGAKSDLRYRPSHISTQHAITV